jgi:hypothetical protein
MYVTSVHTRPSRKTHAGTSPSVMRSCGTNVVIRNIATFAAMIVLSAVEIGPGPIENEDDWDR